MKKIVLYLIVSLFMLGSLSDPAKVSAQSPGLMDVPRLVYLQTGKIQVDNPETSQAFYDELKGSPRDYFIDFPAQGGPASGGELYINLLVPAEANRDGRYSADIFDGQDKKIYSIDSTSVEWQEFYEASGRDYYMKGPELSVRLPAGKYRIEVYSEENKGKYVLLFGRNKSYDIQSLLNLYWQMPYLKATFFKTSVLQFFLTPFGIAGIAVLGALLILLAFLNYLVGLVKESIRQNRAKTLLLTSAGMQMKDEIIKLLQKPAYDITVAFITTAAKPEENIDYVKKDWEIMKDEMGFNIEEVDIEGKKEQEVMKLLRLKDIVFVEGGNTYYLLKAMRGCNFERVIKKLLKSGKVYIGASAGSIVAGRTIQTAGWKKDKNFVGLKNLRGLNLVPFDIFCHFQPEHAEIILQKMKSRKKRLKKLRVITDEQAILVQGKEIDLIGKGEAVII